MLGKANYIFTYTYEGSEKSQSANKPSLSVVQMKNEPNLDYNVECGNMWKSWRR